MAKPTLLVSACLLGCRCRYDGQEKANAAVTALAEDYTLIPVCPEQLGGLSTPRPPAERRGQQVVTATGSDVTANYRLGAEQALHLARLLHCRAAVLKERSPSCGKGQIYDGTFSGTLVTGDGVAAQLLTEQGIPVFGESQLGELEAFLSP